MLPASRLLSTLLAASVVSLVLLSSDSAIPVTGQEGDLEGRYLVTLRADASPSTSNRVTETFGIQPLTYYSEGIRGFAAIVPEHRLQALRDDPEVLAVEPDSIIRAAIHESPFQTLPTGIDRIDDDLYPGAGIGGAAGPDINGDVAVIDSGIDIDHPDLNVAGGVRFTGPACSGGSFDDDFFHGTHVAGTIAAKDDNRGVVGVAPGARLWAIKILDSTGSGFTSCAVAGFDWVTGRRREFNDGSLDGDPGINILVINASLGGPPSGALCTAVSNAVARGILVATAAGNDGEDAATSGPGNCSKGLTVSAYADFDGVPGSFLDRTVSFSNCTETDDDSFGCFSNFGSSVDLAAPGVEIVSTVPNGLYAWAGGTSMATPHVAGALLLYRLQGGYHEPTDGPVVASSLVSAGWTQSQASTCGFTGDPDGFREPLLFLGANCFGDRDGDGVLDQADNCPDWANAAQNLPPWAVPGGDTDCDGFARGHEAYGYYLAARHCAATSTPGDEEFDSWPTDNDDNRWTNLSDVSRIANSYNTSLGSPLYQPRFDVNADAIINLADLVRFSPFYNKTCQGQ